MGRRGTWGGEATQSYRWALELRQGTLFSSVWRRFLTYAKLPLYDMSMAKPRKDYLTERQKAILDFIGEFRREHGISPTHLEIRKRFGYSSYGTVYKTSSSSKTRASWSATRNQKRGIELVREPVQPAEGPPEVELPFFGRIAAGKPDRGRRRGRDARPCRATSWPGGAPGTTTSCASRGTP